MYVREENIEEENLDWGEDLENVDLTTEHVENEDLKNEDETAKESRHTIHPESENNKIIFHNKMNSGRTSNIKQSITNYVDTNSEISLLLAILILPYMVGFVLSYLLYFIYGGMPLGSFLTIEKGNFHFELWSIGAYFFITIGVIGTFITYLKER